MTSSILWNFPDARSVEIGNGKSSEFQVGNPLEPYPRFPFQIKSTAFTLMSPVPWKLIRIVLPEHELENSYPHVDPVNSDRWFCWMLNTWISSLLPVHLKFVPPYSSKTLVLGVVGRVFQYCDFFWKTSFMAS